MTSLELLESFVTVKDKYVLEAHEEAVPGENIISFTGSLKAENSTADTETGHGSRRSSLKKSVLLAWFAAAVLMLAGFAYGIMKLQELSLGEYTYTRPDSENPSETVNATGEFISLQGLKDSPEYQATRQWQDFLQDYDKDGAIIAQIGNQPTGLEEKYSQYGVYTQKMCDMLEQIAKEYDLKLHSALVFADEEELNNYVGGRFLKDGLSMGEAYIYENGTFQFDTEALIDGHTVHLQFRRSVKGTMDETILNIGSAEEYQEAEYETACGEKVFLELGKDHSFIYADFEECFLFLNVLAGREAGFLGETEGAVTMENLKQMADLIDFSILKNVREPDIQGNMASQNQAASSEENVPSGDLGGNALQYHGDGRMEAYRTLLTEVCLKQKFPCKRKLSYDGSPMSDNQFAVADIDGDGREELILVYITASVADSIEIIYDYDEETGSVREQFAEYPAVTHFDNGILQADWSHNQGLAGRVWPYTLYRYNAEKDTYEAVAMVDAWDKSLTDKNYEGDSFPDEADRDGDLLLYYIMEPDQYKLKNPVDGKAYENWLADYNGDAGIVNLDYKALTEENIFRLN